MPQTVSFHYIFHIVQMVAFQAGQEMPPEAWWLPALVLMILGLSATVDALTGTIPDWIIFFGLASVVVTLGLMVNWPFAADHLRLAVEAGIGLWLLNLLWRRAFKGDAYGMGDAKWTMLAVSVFGLAPALFAWGAAAILAVLWMGGAQLVRRPVANVHFGPFLFIGLMVGIYWLRLR